MKLVALKPFNSGLVGSVAEGAELDVPTEYGQMLMNQGLAKPKRGRPKGKADLVEENKLADPQSDSQPESPGTD